MIRLKRHGDRRGFLHTVRGRGLTGDAEAGASIFRGLDMSFHRNVESPRLYVTGSERFRGHVDAGMPA